MTFPPVEEQLRVIKRGVVDLVDEKELIERLEESRAQDRPLRVKLGIDPSSPDIHVGHTVPLRKLADFQRLGHRAVVLWGTATARLGDPTGRNKTRPQLSAAEVEANKATYAAQVRKVLDLDRAEVRENAEWFEAMSFMDCVSLCSRFTVAQILDRDSFKNRFEAGIAISIHEMIYPLMQGWDSVELRADVEIGATDQLFNLLVGRELQRQEGQRPQICLTLPIVEGLDGVQKMSKSLGNYIGVDEDATQMFGKTMSVPDPLMEKYFTLLTDVPAEEVSRLLAGHPRDAKVALAKEIVRIYHGAEAAERAAVEFDRVFREGGLPDEIPEATIRQEDLREGRVLLAAALARAGLCATNSEGRRLIQSGAVRVDEEPLRDPAATLGPGRYLVRVGKRKAARITVPG